MNYLKEQNIIIYILFCYILRLIKKNNVIKNFSKKY